MQHHPDDIICGCLNVTAAEIQQAASTQQIRSLRDAAYHTGAGTGCTACHCTIRDLLGGCNREIGQPAQMAAE